MSFYFPKQRIEVLKSSDFNTDSDDKITIKKRDLTLILFQDHSSLSQQTTSIWENLSKKIVGIIFTVCDLNEETNIATYITNISSDNTSPYQKIFKHPPPFIVTYRNGKPQEVYKGVISEGRLTNYCLSLITNKDTNDIHKPIVEVDSSKEDDSDLPKVVKHTDDDV